jgi:uncharacterized protein
MNIHPSSFLSPRCEGRSIPELDMNGVFAIQPIKKGELIAIFGGTVMEWDSFKTLPDKIRSLSIQVEENLYLAPEIIGQGDYFNHSCDANAGLIGQITLYALRDVQVGEEVCFDYAMSDCSPYDEFDCQCGAHNCRKNITGNDWQIKELQDRYAGFFAPHVQRRIDEQKAHQPRKFYAYKAMLQSVGIGNG